MDVNHEKGCRCVICSGEMTRKQLTSHERKLMETYGWYAHSVIGDPQAPTGVNYHTHGFNESLGHPDLQIVFPVPENVAHAITKTIYDQIQAGSGAAQGPGWGFKDGAETMIPREGGSQYPVRFIKVREGDRQVLRVILPNPEGQLEPKDLAEDDNPAYALQWTVAS